MRDGREGARLALCPAAPARIPGRREVQWWRAWRVVARRVARLLHAVLELHPVGQLREELQPALLGPPEGVREHRRGARAERGVPLQHRAEERRRLGEAREALERGLAVEDVVVPLVPVVSRVGCVMLCLVFHVCRAVSFPWQVGSGCFTRLSPNGCFPPVRQ